MEQTFSLAAREKTKSFDIYFWLCLLLILVGVVALISWFKG